MDPDRALLIACLDLTSLGDVDDALAAHAVCRRALDPFPEHPALHVAAVCIWPRWLATARGYLTDSPVRLACATGGFPVPDAPLDTRLREIERAVAAGADEVDVPINRFLVDERGALEGELSATRRAAAGASWKAIVETGALQPNQIRTLATAAIAAGADFVKSSTGKDVPGVTPEGAAILAETVRDAGRQVGLKLSGGIRGVAQATNHLQQIRAILGPGWPEPSRFRIGASTLLDALLA
ncbi:MAG: deoxyribose-phosphate aldolase [Actinomycetota bacterium]